MKTVIAIFAVVACIGLLFYGFARELDAPVRYYSNSTGECVFVEMVENNKLVKKSCIAFKQKQLDKMERKWAK